MYTHDRRTSTNRTLGTHAHARTCTHARRTQEKHTEAEVGAGLSSCGPGAYLKHHDFKTPHGRFGTQLTGRLRSVSIVSLRVLARRAVGADAYTGGV